MKKYLQIEQDLLRYALNVDPYNRDKFNTILGITNTIIVNSSLNLFVLNGNFDELDRSIESIFLKTQEKQNFLELMNTDSFCFYCGGYEKGGVSKYIQGSVKNNSDLWYILNITFYKNRYHKVPPIYNKYYIKSFVEKSDVRTRLGVLFDAEKISNLRHRGVCAASEVPAVWDYVLFNKSKRIFNAQEIENYEASKAIFEKSSVGSN